VGCRSVLTGRTGEIECARAIRREKGCGADRRVGPHDEGHEEVVEQVVHRRGVRQGVEHPLHSLRVGQGRAVVFAVFEDALPFPLGVELAVELRAVDRCVVQSEGLVRLIVAGQGRRAGGELGDAIVVSHVGLEPSGKP